MARKIPSRMPVNGSAGKPKYERLTSSDEERLCELAIDKGVISSSGRFMLIFMKRLVRGKLESFKFETTPDLEMARREIKRHLQRGCVPA